MSSLQDQLKSRHRSQTEVCYCLEPARSGTGLDTIEMNDGVYIIGSGNDADIRVDVPGIAPRHCRLTCERERMVLQAEDTRTWLNDGPIRKANVRSGDRLSIGPANFIVRIDRRQVDSESEPDEEPVQLAAGIAQAIRKHRLSASAKEMIPRTDAESAPSSAEQELEELRKSLARTQQQLDAHKAAMREQPEPVHSPLHTPMSELTGSQTRSKSEETPAAPDWEKRLREKTEQIHRLKNRLLQRKNLHVRSIELQRQQIESAQQTLAQRLEELMAREESLEGSATARQEMQKAQLEELEGQLQSTREEIQELVARLDREQDERQTLEQRLDETSRDLETNRQENDQLRTELYREVSARAELESVLSVERDRCTFAEHQLSEAEIRCSQYSEQQADLNETLKQLKAEYEEQIQQLDALSALEAQLDDVQTDREKLQEAYDEALGRHQEELSELQERASNAEAEAKSNAAELEAAREALQEQQSALVESTERLQNLESQLAEFEAAEQNHKQLLNERDELLQEREQVAADHERLQNDYQQLTSERDSLAQRLEEVAKQSNVADDDAVDQEQLQSEMQSLQEALHELKEAYESLAAENEQLQSELIESRKTLQEISDERDALQSQLSVPAEPAEVEEKSTAFEEGLLEEIESLRELVATLESGSASDAAYSDPTDMDRTELDSEWERISDERDRLLELRQAVEEERDAFHQVRLDLQQMQQEVAQQQTEYDQKLEEVKQLRNELQQSAGQSAPASESEEESTVVETFEEESTAPAETAEAGSLMDSLLWRDATSEEADEDPVLADSADEVFETDQPVEDDEDFGLDLQGLRAALNTRDNDEETEEVNEDEDHVEPIQKSGESQDIRRRLAEMFGIDDEETHSEAAEDSDPNSEEDQSSYDEFDGDSAGDDIEVVSEQDEEVVEESSTEEAPTRGPNGEVIVDDIEDADSVAAYMERLFARTNNRQTSEPAPAPGVRKAPRAPERVSAPQPVLKAATSLATQEQAESEDLDEPQETPPERGPLGRVDRELVMKEIASLRDVANQNARESLIAHKWKQLRVGVLMNIALTTIALVGAVVLFTAPLWYGEQFLIYAATMAVLGLFSGFSLFNHYVTLVRMRQPASSGQQPKSRKSAEIENSETLVDGDSTEE
ncbi:FHA domain-containing protein [Rubinisphaera margarita]|uniref:FHA domain-containing protein n=1 Tax=Rubinisphaera margarita TaxID=2909586 RepID=UPI001EE79363|nr:FHA domain-containing protein [Rubinisphaera margarita]MCG6158537.1 FHA domain-containing protein [Rubinisphaera margarita]